MVSRGPVTDAAAMLDVLAAAVPGEPYPLLARPAQTYLAAALRAAPRRLRIGRYTLPGARGHPGPGLRRRL